MGNIERQQPPLILASASPRRRELLALLDIPFDIQTAAVDEDVITLSDPAENVLARAQLKAAALEAVLTDDEARSRFWLTADTTVAIDGKILNKPADAAQARAMLKRLRGRTHQVFTAVALTGFQAGQRSQNSRVKGTAVTMRPYDDQDISRYIDSGDPFDKAGAYAIQHPIFKPVADLQGCYTSVVGLPVCETAELLAAANQLPAPPHSEFPSKMKGQGWQDCRICQKMRSKNSYSFDGCAKKC